ncbi:S1/P1 nuclease [Lentinula raphanica]|nr:S1/P1 nuclease [Lentinula raphanica]KAJ3976484.1 S1/P1 nuclease [Lentinula raphanica]
MKLPLLSLAFFVPRVLGWGAAGHEIVATIAQIHLHPTVLPVLCDILNYTSPNPNEPPCHLAPVSTWADRLKYRMRWSAPLHYVGAKDDYPSETCVFPGERGWAGSRDINVLAGIRNVTSLLDAWVDDGQTTSDDTAEEALKFLIHFIGDLHMPLHLTGRDRGGNSVKVRFDGRQTNLHSAWDGLLIAKTLRNVPRKYDRPLPIPSLERNLRGAIYDGFVRQIMWEGILHDWKDQVPEWLMCPPTQEEESFKSITNRGYSNPLFNYGSQLWSYLSSYLIPTSSPTDDSTVCPHFWAKPIHAMNCDFIWPKALDEPPYSHSQSRFDEDEAWKSHPKTPLLELDTPQYSGYIAENRILERLMAQAGIRLAGILNWLFADQAELGMDGRLTREERVQVLGRRVKELFVTSPDV